MNKINSYNIKPKTLEKSEILNFINSKSIPLQILNIYKDKFDLIEQFVYETACFHIKQLYLNDTNLEKDISNYYIEFWSKNNVGKNADMYNGINNFHIDCDENNKKKNNKIIHPLLSCVTYLNDSEFPFVLTDIDYNEFIFKEFENKQNIQLIFPREYKQITFDGSKYHGVCDIFDKFINTTNLNTIDRNIIAINIWRVKPSEILYYESEKLNNCIYNKIETVFDFLPEENMTIIDTLNLKPFSFDFYETMLYNSNKFCFSKEISELVKTQYNKNNFNILLIDTNDDDNNNNTKHNNKTLFNDIKIMNELNTDTDITQEIEQKNKIVNSIIYNRFIQRHTYPKIYSKNVCEWIIFESENYAKNNGGWTTQRHKKYPTTDLPVKNIMPILNFVLMSFNSIFSKIQKSYSLNDNIEFNVTDLFIVKYNSNTQNELELHTDGSFLSANILLSDPKDFEGGGTYFNDGTTTFLEQGDVLIHSGQIKHSGLKITNGIRYILVVFISLNIKIT